MAHFHASLHLLLGTCCLLSPLAAQNAPKATLLSTATTPEAFCYHEYPSWSAIKKEVESGQTIRNLKTTLEQAQKQLDAIGQLAPEQITFDNTLGMIDRLQEDIDRLSISIYQLSIIGDTPEVRKALDESSQLTSAFWTDFYANSKLWAVIKTAASQEWAKNLDPERKRSLQQAIDAFTDNGANLDDKSKARAKEIQAQLTKLTTQFGKNVLDSTNAWQLVITDAAQLKGMKENWMKGAAEAALKKGFGTVDKPQWLITLDYSSCEEVMSYCEVEETRQRVYRGTTTVGRVAPYINEPLVHEIAQLRQELAQIYGFKSFVDYATARRMAKNAATAENFILDLRKRAIPAYKKERADILAFIGKCQGLDGPAPSIAPWDASYYSTKYAEEKNKFDADILRPYLPLPQVEAGMIAIYDELLGIEVRPIPTAYYGENKEGKRAPKGTAEVWDPAVRAYEVFDAQSKKKLGSFYIDLHPRPNKRGGAWMMPLRSGESGRDNKPYRPHLASVVGNFTPPVGDEPALLSFGEVITLFHEYGHLLHAVLSDTTLRSHAGTNVPWDFVEMPSQLLEYWAWDDSFLKKYAKHYKTGEPMPAELINKLKQSKRFLAGVSVIGQTNFGLLDFAMHLNYDKYLKGKSLDEASKIITGDAQMPFTEDRPTYMHQFTHCIDGGYSGTYYSYKWAKVLSADAFSRFAKEGTMNKKTGASLRKEILSKGNSQDVGQLFENFMGRKADSNALLRDAGMLDENEK